MENFSEYISTEWRRDAEQLGISNKKDALIVKSKERRD